MLPLFLDNHVNIEKWVFSTIGNQTKKDVSLAFKIDLNRGTDLRIQIGEQIDFFSTIHLLHKPIKYALTGNCYR